MIASRRTPNLDLAGLDRMLEYNVLLKLGQ